KPVVTKVSTNTSTSGLSPDVVALTDSVKALLLKNTTPPPASVKAVKESCVTCAGPHPYYQCLATDGNTLGYQDNIQAYVFAAAVTIIREMLDTVLRVPEEGDLKAITTRSGVSYDGPPIPPPFSPYPKVVEREPELNAYLADLGESINLRPSPYGGSFYAPEDVLLLTKDLAWQSHLISEPIIAKSSPSLTPFEGGDFILKEIKAYLASDSVPPRIDDAEFEPGGDISLIKEMLNKDPYSPLPPKDLKCEELKSVKSSVDEPPELELKDLPSHLEYAFLEGTNKLPIIIAKNLKDEEKKRLINVLKSYKQAIAWKLSDIKGIDPQFCTHKILMEDDFKSAVQHQRRVNPKIHEVIKKEVVKLLDAGLIYPISDSPWVSPVHCVPKKGGMTIVTNEDNELISGLERLAGNEYYCFLDGFSGCMMDIFQDMIEETMEVFMDDFSLFGDSFSSCLSHLDKMLKRCEDANLILNWEKCHFMVKEGIFLGHKISKPGIEVDRAKVDVIAKLPPPTFPSSLVNYLSIISECSGLRSKDIVGLFVTACELYGVQQVYFDIGPNEGFIL
ncbi:reverse transcriptase domain-containing protein, partial [Tanacetum coccineum]